MSCIYHTEDGRAALKKVGVFDMPEPDPSDLVKAFAPHARAVAALAMIEWLVEHWDNLAVERFPVNGWCVSVLRPDMPHSLALAKEFIGSSGTTLDEALVRAVLASKEKT